MKLLLRLSVAVLLVASTFAAAVTPLSLEQFVKDPQVQTLAPHLLDEITAQGIESFSTPPQDFSKLTKDFKLPLLDDIIQVVSLNIFYGDDADWSRLETAKLKATQEHGPEALAAAANLTEMDTRRAALIVNTIYDTVINMPPPSKESHAAKKLDSKKDDMEETAPEANTDTENKPKEEDSEHVKRDNSALSPLWDMLGFGLIKSSNTVKKAKGIVTPSNVCETTDTAYLKGVDDVVYYSSLTHGLAGGALASAPADSAIKSLDLQTIVSSIGRLAIEIQMAQSVARLANLNPADPQVRTITFLALTSESASSPSAQNARDINNLVNKGLGGEIPEEVLHSLADQAALSLITRGAGQAGQGPALFYNIPVVRNFIAFSSEVLNANNLGNVLKYVFCPDAQHTTESPMAEVVVGDIKKGAEDASQKGSEAAQKAFKAPEEAVKNAAEDAKEKVMDAKEDASDKGQKVAEGLKDAKDQAAQKAAEAGAAVKDKIYEAGSNAQEKVTEGTEYVNAAGEKFAQGVKDTATDAKKSAEDTVEAAQKKAAEGAAAAKKKAADGAAAAKEKVAEGTAAAKEKAAEGAAAAKEKVDAAEEEVKRKAREAGKKVAGQVEDKAEKVADKAEEIKQEL